ncbi:hypothetical protein CJD36_018040 [Flavipsychrobacter stenotrophus]|uniref:Uncharacterized protein n=1 Tax=Flavipsychrobacter stenotrophus TaxID=2077091 RepID=A0A2S7STA4_9BACT|nr:hypothetical protein CJD36_018040 [Flavipsychrobacter stenotrophus]
MECGLSLTPTLSKGEGDVDTYLKRTDPMAVGQRPTAGGQRGNHRRGSVNVHAIAWVCDDIGEAN